MATSDQILKVLVQTQSDLAGLTKLVGGLQQVKVAAVDAGAAFKFAGAEEVLRRMIDLVKDLGQELVNVVKESIAEAAQAQTQMFPLVQMLKDSGKATEEIFKGINKLVLEAGVISDASLARMAQTLTLMDVPAENLISRMTALSKIAVATGVDVDGMAVAYAKFRNAVETDTPPVVRGSMEVMAIMNALKDHFGVTGVALKNMFKEGKVTIDDLNKALKESGAEGGRFANAFKDKQATFEGATLAMRTAWKEFQEELGKPLVDALTQAIQEIAKIERALVQIAQNRGWQVALELAWEIVMNKLAEITATVLIATFTKLGPAAAEAWFLGWVERVKNLFSGRTLQDLLKGDLTKIFDPLLAITGSPELTKAVSVILQRITGGTKEEIEKAKKELAEILAQSAAETPALTPEVGEPTEKVLDVTKIDQTKLALQELETALQRIQQQQTLIQGEPFLGIDEKQRQMLISYAQEVQNLILQIGKLEKLKAKGGLDPEQLAEVNQKLQEAGFRVDQIRQKMQGLAAPFHKSMQDWADSMGSVGQQVAGSLQQTIGATFQSLNQYLLTGEFNARQLLQSLANIALQLIEQLAIQQVMALFRTQQSTAAATEGATIAAANAPAAAATSIAQYGPIVGAVAAVAAVAAIIAAILLAHEGGRIERRRVRRFHGGGLASDEVPIIAQEGEIMIRRDVAQAPGMASFLLGLNAMHDGGVTISGGGPRSSRQSNWQDYQDMVNRFGLGRGFDPTGPIGFQAYAPPPYYPPGTVPGETLTPGDLIRLGRDLGGGSLGWGMWSPLPGAGPGTPGMGGSLMLGQGQFWKPWLMNRTTEGKNPSQGVHSGGLIRRLHGGGSVTGGGGGAGVHIYAFTDLKALTKHMASKAGQKIIFDTVKGRRIDLGMS